MIVMITVFISLIMNMGGYEQCAAQRFLNETSDESDDDTSDSDDDSDGDGDEFNIHDNQHNHINNQFDNFAISEESSDEGIFSCASGSDSGSNSDNDRLLISFHNSPSLTFPSNKARKGKMER